MAAQQQDATPFQCQTNVVRLMAHTLRKLALRGSLLLSALLIPVAVGHCSISIMPMEANLQATVAGNAVSDEIEVMNRDTSAVQVTASVMDWTMTVSGQKRFFEAGTQPNSCAKAIQLNPMQFVLASGQSLRVRYSISPLPDMTTEQNAMIFFTTRGASSANTGGIGLKVNTRIGCKVFVAPAQKAAPQAKIVDMNWLQSEAQKPAKVKVTVENFGLSNVRLTGKVEVRDSNDQIVARGDILPKPALVFVGARRELEVTCDKSLPPGVYLIKTVIDYGAEALIGGQMKVTIPDAQTPAAPTVPVQ